MKRLLLSGKFWAAIIGILSVVAVEAFGIAEISVDKIAEAIMAIIGILIAAIAGEDIAKSLAGGAKVKKR